MPIEDTPEAWQAYCFGGEGADGAKEAESDKEAEGDEEAGAASAAGHEPALPLLQQLDQVGTLWHVRMGE